MILDYQKSLEPLGGFQTSKTFGLTFSFGKAPLTVSKATLIRSTKSIL